MKIPNLLFQITDRIDASPIHSIFNAPAPISYRTESNHKTPAKSGGQPNGSIRGCCRLTEGRRNVPFALLAGLRGLPQRRVVEQHGKTRADKTGIQCLIDDISPPRKRFDFE